MNIEVKVNFSVPDNKKTQFVLCLIEEELFPELSREHLVTPNDSTCLLDHAPELNLLLVMHASKYTY